MLFVYIALVVAYLAIGMRSERGRYATAVHARKMHFVKKRHVEDELRAIKARAFALDHEPSCDYDDYYYEHSWTNNYCDCDGEVYNEFNRLSDLARALRHKHDEIEHSDSEYRKEASLSARGVVLWFVPMMIAYLKGGTVKMTDHDKTLMLEQECGINPMKEIA